MSLRGVYRGPYGILCTRGEKEHTSKRVSVIVRDNVISKAQCATHSRFLMLVYLRLFEFGNVRIIICWHYKTDLNFGDSQNITLTKSK